MIRYLKLFGYVLTISFLGSLPVGTLNINVAGLVINKRIPDAFAFALGAILVEMIVVRIALATVKKLKALRHLYKFFNGITCLILFSFAGMILYAALRMQKLETTLPLTSQHPFLSGLILSVLNPLHLPFWIGWTAILQSKGIFWHSRSSYNIYVFGIGVGTTAAFLIYGTLGNILIEFLRQKQTMLNWVIGLSLLMTAFVQFYKGFIRQNTNDKKAYS